MSWTAPPVDRPDPATVNAERAALQDWLDFHRRTLLMKCAGLDAAQLKSASMPPSNLTLLGLVRHMVDVELSWFRRGAAGLDVPFHYYRPDSRDADFDETADADAQADLDLLRAEWTLGDDAVSGLDLDATFVRRDETFDVRWAYLHVIEEYARHNGHADLVRERIDGATGD